MRKPTAWIQSESARSPGLFLLFLAIIALVPVPVLLVKFEFAQARSFFWTWFPVALAAGGLYLRNFTRKRFWVEPGRLTVRDGLALVPTVYRWQGNAHIALRGYEDHQGEWWLIDLVCGKPRYPLHKSLHRYGEMRHLAVTLARAVGGSLVENETVIIPSTELDLSLTERLRCHPELLGAEVPRPLSSRVELKESPRRLHFYWKHPWIQVLLLGDPVLGFEPGCR